MAGWQAWCSERGNGCGWTIRGLTKEAVRDARRWHWREAHFEPPEQKPLHVQAPYRGRPNNTHLQILRMAAAGELYATVSVIYFWTSGALDFANPEATCGPPEISWIPASDDRRITRWIPGLLLAGLLRDPKQEPGSGMPNTPYRVTPEGRRVLQQHTRQSA